MGTYNHFMSTMSGMWYTQQQFHCKGISATDFTVAFKCTSVSFLKYTAGNWILYSFSSGGAKTVTTCGTCCEIKTNCEEEMNMLHSGRLK